MIRPSFFAQIFDGTINGALGGLSKEYRYNKVNRCLARYSPRATTNQWAPNLPKKAYFGVKVLVPTYQKPT